MLIQCWPLWLQEYKIHNAEVLFREDADMDDLIDVIEGNRRYIRMPVRLPCSCWGLLLPIILSSSLVRLYYRRCMERIRLGGLPLAPGLRLQHHVFWAHVLLAFMPCKAPACTSISCCACAHLFVLAPYLAATLTFPSAVAAG